MITRLYLCIQHSLIRSFDAYMVHWNFELFPLLFDIDIDIDNLFIFLFFFYFRKMILKMDLHPTNNIFMLAISRSIIGKNFHIWIFV